MTIKCTELIKKDNRSIVEVRDMDADKILNYVVCYDFDNSKAYGNKWGESKTFAVQSYSKPEEILEKAIRELYGISKTPISFERLVELAKAVIAELEDYVADDEDFVNIFNNIKITEDEADVLNIKDKVFPQLFKIVNVTFKREQYVTVKVVMPDDEDVWSAEEYVENRDYLEDDPDIESEDWEYDDYGIEVDRINKNEFKSRYDNDTVWNADDIDDM